ncbi:MAG: hypothetical protein ACYCQI_04815 [Gammaproteobacteria bacterium]
MKKLGMKYMLVTAFLAAYPFASYAQDNLEAFKTSCVNAWMDKAKASDQVEYKNFGEKYCDCVATQPIDTDAQMSSAAKLCMSRVLIHDTMDTLEDEVGLSNLNADKIQKGCLDKWNAIATALVGDAKGQVDNYCKCATPKLTDLNTNRDNYTDKEWATKIDSIADSCSDNVTPDKSALTGAKKN